MYNISMDQISLSRNYSWYHDLMRMEGILNILIIIFGDFL